MLSHELLTALRKLDRAGKLRAVQILVNALAVEEEALLVPRREYEVWSPYDAPGAAETLLAMLDADERSCDA